MLAAIAKARPRRAGARRAARLFAVALLLAGGWGVAPSAQPRSAFEPVAFSPAETDALLARVRQGLVRDRELEAQYTYLEKRRDVKVSKLGRVTLGEVRTFEVYPSIEPGRTYKRLIAINDVPIPPPDLAKRDAAHRQRREVDETFDSYRYVVEGRDLLDGHPQRLLRVRMTPRRDFRPSSDNDFVKYARKFAGQAWVDERDGQVVRIALEAIEPLSVGFGIVGRVHKGSVATFERRKVNDEVWLPWRARLDVTGRVAMFRKFDVETETTWWDYKKFSVDTGVVDVRPR